MSSLIRLVSQAILHSKIGAAGLTALPSTADNLRREVFTDF